MIDPVVTIVNSGNIVATDDDDSYTDTTGKAFGDKTDSSKFYATVVFNPEPVRHTLPGFLLIMIRHFKVGLKLNMDLS